MAALLVVVLDQATKTWAVARLRDADPIEVIPGVLSFTFVLNPGAAFGMATGATPILTTLAIVISAIVLFVARRIDDRWWGLALGLLLAGAVGNLIDRLFRAPGPFRGHVVDFLQFDFIDFPVFNVADSAITVAAGLIILQALRGVDLDGTRERDKAEQDDSGDDLDDDSDADDGDE